MSKQKSKIAVLTGAGISAESGIKTFRDAGGLWEHHDIMEVASIEGWHNNQALVLNFYNERRRQLAEVQPNAAHKALVELESRYDVTIITQNVDDLHERGGSSHIIHLHGELKKSRSTVDERLIYPCPGDILPGDCCEKGSQLRPHIVWFGEMVPMLEVAAEAVSRADLILIIGTSMQVYPAAGLTAYASPNIPIFYVNQKPMLNYELENTRNLKVIPENATTGVRKVVDELIQIN
ncbi:MAG: NAD-dependent deacylase [Saprospiraceae bacterium]|nr:MAG: NAD-dependent deacylase [Saprospiraceae bacterium]